MSDPFSLATGLFAIIGVVDVVARASVEIYNVLSDIKHAPKEIEDLRRCIADNTQLLGTTRALLKELKSEVPSGDVSSAESNQMLSDLTSAIKAMGRELESLERLAKRYNIAHKSWGKVKWVLDQRRVGRSLSKFEQTKTALSCALTLAGWQQQRLKLKEIKTLVQGNSRDGVLQRQTLLSIEKDGRNLSLNQDQCAAASRSFIPDSNRLQQHVLKVEHTSRSEHLSTRSHVDQSNSETVQTLSAKMDERQIAVKPVKPIRKSFRTIHFFGERRSNPLALLLMIKNQFRCAVLQVLSQKEEGVSSDHLLWLQSEFEHLIASGTQEAARVFGGSTATSFDSWTYSGGCSSSKAKAPLGPPSWKQCPPEKKDNSKQSHRRVRSKSLCSGSKSISIRFPIGKVRITVPCVQGSSGAACCQERVSFSITPCRWLLPDFIDVCFAKSLFNGLEPRIYGQVNTFRLVDDWIPHHRLMSQGTVKDMDDAFRDGTISPYDMNKFGHNCCLGYAVFFGRVDVLKYLDDQGVGVRSMKGNYGMLEASWEAILSDSRDVESTVDLQRLFAYLGQNATLTFDSLPLGALNWIWEGPCSETTVGHARHWMNLLEEEECDFNRKDEFGLTPLFSHLSRPGGQSLALVRLLLEFDADFNEKDPLGASTIQVAMYSGFGESLRDLSDVLEEKIALMIELGVDIHHRNMKGLTPSQFPHFGRDSWTAWCRALQRNGLSIEDILREDDELDLLDIEPGEGDCYLGYNEETESRCGNE